MSRHLRSHGCWTVPQDDMFTMCSWGSIRSGLFAQWCIYLFCVQCLGERSLCGWSSGVVWAMLFWSRMRENKQERSEGKKVLRQSPNISLLTVCLPQLGPSIDPHMHTPWPPHYHTHTSTSLPDTRGFCLIQTEVLMSRVWLLPLSLSGVPVHLNIQLQ